MTKDEQSSSENFINWLKQAGIKWDEKRMEIKCEEGCFSVRAKVSIEYNEGDVVICRIPKYAILSCKTSSIAAKVFDKYDIEGPLALSLAIMHEQSLGESSWFYGYLQSLPQRADGMPIFWDDKTRQECTPYLVGTEIELSVLNDYKLMRQDYAECIVPILKKFKSTFKNASFYTFEAFLNASSLVASRCFHVDSSWHCDSMVPFADLFNHCSGGEHVHITGTEQDEGDEPDIMEMVTLKSVNAGQEVFNTYGDQSTGSLLLKYGFVEEQDNVYDSVYVPLEMVLDVCSQTMTFTVVKNRLSTWKQLRTFLLCLLDDMRHTGNESECETDESDATTCDDEWSDEGEPDDETEVDSFRFAFNGSCDGEIFTLLYVLHVDDLDMLQKAVATCDLDDESIEAFKSTHDKIKSSSVNGNISGKIRQLLLKILQARKSRYASLSDALEHTHSPHIARCLKVRQSELKVIDRAIARYS